MCNVKTGLAVSIVCVGHRSHNSPCPLRRGDWPRCSETARKLELEDLGLCLRGTATVLCDLRQVGVPLWVFLRFTNLDNWY